MLLPTLPPVWIIFHFHPASLSMESPKKKKKNPKKLAQLPKPTCADPPQQSMKCRHHMLQLHVQKSKECHGAAAMWTYEQRAAQTSDGSWKQTNSWMIECSSCREKNCVTVVQVYTTVGCLTRHTLEAKNAGDHDAGHMYQMGTPVIFPIGHL